MTALKMRKNGKEILSKITWRRDTSISNQSFFAENHKFSENDQTKILHWVSRERFQKFWGRKKIWGFFLFLISEKKFWNHVRTVQTAILLTFTISKIRRRVQTFEIQSGYISRCVTHILNICKTISLAPSCSNVLQGHFIYIFVNRIVTFQEIVIGLCQTKLNTNLNMERNLLRLCNSCI